MPTPSPTVDELISTIKRTNIPTVVVEGNDDVVIYRLLEEQLASVGADFLPCGGRPKLFEIYRRRNEFPGRRVAFLADSDLYIFSGIPLKYSGIIFTSGYSIENDLYASGILERLLSSEEKSSHVALVHSLSKWMAFEVAEAQRGNPAILSASIEETTDNKTQDLDKTWKIRRPFVDPNAQSIQDVYIDYQSLIRGKQLFQAIVRFLSRRSRGTTYNYGALYDMCIRLGQSDAINHTMHLLEKRLVLVRPGGNSGAED